MKRTAIHTLGILFAFATIAPTALATEIAAKSEVTNSIRAAYTPHTLVGAAYNGRLEGIPSYGTLETNALTRRIAAKDLVTAAIAEGRLTEAHLEDEGFLKAVEANLRGLNAGS